MDIGEWLRSIDLGQYEATFRDNEIDDEIVRSLTADDLKDLGVTLVGHRRRILTAIAELSTSARHSRGCRHRAPAACRRIPAATAERRQLTVLFCDLVGSTAMSARLDPEDMREIIRAYQDACTGVIARYDGFVAKFMGDGVLAYFGFPRAHEDDAERAVRAGLDLTDAVANLQTPTARNPADAHRCRDRDRRRRRPRRPRVCAGASRHRRYAQSGRAPAIARRAGWRPHRRSDASAARRRLRVEAARSA